MSWDNSSGMMADISMRIELKRLAERADASDNGPLMAILEVAIGTLDERIADPASYARTERPPRQSACLICRNVRIAGRRTSLKLEAEFWQALEVLAAETECSLDELCEQARRRHPDSSLASAIRVMVLERHLNVMLPPLLGSKIYSRRRQRLSSSTKEERCDD